MESTSSYGFTFEASSLLISSSSSVNKLLYSLQQLETRLERVQQMPSESEKLAMQPAIEKLTEHIRHPDLDVNVAVACCMCEVLRITGHETPYSDEQMKEFFQLLVTTFEKLSPGYAKMVKVLRALDIGKLSMMMCGLQLDGLIVRLFQQFLTVADSNSAAVVSNMKQIMVMIIEKMEPLNHMLVDLLLTSVRMENEISLPVCRQLGRDVLSMCAAQLKPHLPKEVPEELPGSLIEKDATRKRKLKCVDGSSNMVQPVRRRRTVRERKMKSLSTLDPPMPDRSAIEVQSVEHGEIFGRRIKVWSSRDQIYYQAVVKSFNCENKKHKVLFDQGEEEFLDIKQEGVELVKKASLSASDIQLIHAGKKLSVLPSSTAELLNDLQDIEKLLQSVQLPKGKGKHLQSESMKYAMHPIIEALAAKELLRHPDMDVNISVACCICDVLTAMEGNAAFTNEQMKDFFELAVTTFEKLSSASRGCYTKLFKVLKRLSNLSFAVLESDLRLNQLIVRLFKQFLTVADSNSFDAVVEMKKIVTIIIEESKPLNPELVDLLVASARKENKNTSPLCWKLGNEVLEECAAKLKPHLQDKVVKYEANPLREPTESSSDRSKLNKNNIQQTNLRNRPSTPVIELLSDDDDDDKERIFRTGKQGKLRENVSAAPGDLISVHGYSVKQSIAPIFEVIFNKHGDILAECTFDKRVKAALLEVICEVSRQIETSDVKTIMCEMKEIESKLSQAETAKINVSWLRDELKIIHRRNEVSASLKEMKATTIVAKRVAQADLRERRRELVVAQEQCAKAESCVRALDIVEEKLSKDIKEIES